MWNRKDNKFNLRVFIMLFFTGMLLSSCWAPRCPMETCRSKYEHKHNDLVSGLFSPRQGIPYKLHYLWDKDKGENNPDIEFVPGSGGKSKKKTKKRYPWERW